MFSFAKILLLVFIGCAAAQNVITSITAETTLIAGQPFTITWTPDSSSTVTLTLRQGDASDLEIVGTIAVDIPNTGSYTWYPETTLPSGTDYALEISDSDGSNPNYSHYFGISSEGSASSVTSAASVSDTTSLPASLVTDSLLSTTPSGSSVLVVSGNSTMTSFSSFSTTSSSVASLNSTASSTISTSSASSASRSASIASASASHSSAATHLIAEIVGAQGVMTLIALSLASMIFCMM